MFPKPKPSLTPNTYAYESEPLVKPTGFREYDARWLFGKEINLMGVQALGMGLGTLIRETGREARDRHRPRFPRLFGLGEDLADLRTAGGRLQGARHRAGDDADGLFRAVRSRRALRRDGDGLAQRQRLDRREDGRQPPAHLRAGRDDAAEGHRAQRRLQAAGRRLLCVRGELPGALHRRSDQAPEAQAQAQGGLRLRQRHGRRVRAAGAGGDRLRGGAARLRARSHVSEIQSESRRHGNAARHARRGVAHQGGCRPGLRRRRRPLRRGRRSRRGDLRRQGRRDAGARHVHAASELDVRGRREIDRPLRHRSGAAEERRQGRLLEDRPFLHEAPHPRVEARSPASRSRATISSTSRSAAATTTASSRRSRSAT